MSSDFELEIVCMALKIDSGAVSLLVKRMHLIGEIETVKEDKEKELFAEILSEEKYENK